MWQEKGAKREFLVLSEGRGGGTKYGGVAQRRHVLDSKERSPVQYQSERYLHARDCWEVPSNTMFPLSLAIYLERSLEAENYRKKPGPLATREELREALPINWVRKLSTEGKVATDARRRRRGMSNRVYFHMEMREGPHAKKSQLR